MKTLKAHHAYLQGHPFCGTANGGNDLCQHMGSWKAPNPGSTADVQSSTTTGDTCGR